MSAGVSGRKHVASWKSKIINGKNYGRTFLSWDITLRTVVMLPTYITINGTAPQVWIGYLHNLWQNSHALGGKSSRISSGCGCRDWCAGWFVTQGTRAFSVERGGKEVVKPGDVWHFRWENGCYWKSQLPRNLAGQLSMTNLPGLHPFAAQGTKKTWTSDNCCLV